MKNPSAPLKITWIIGLLAGLFGIIGYFTEVQFFTENSFMLLLIGFLVLAAGTSMKGI